MTGLKRTQGITGAAARSPGAKKRWISPEIRILGAGDAENSANPGGGDGVFTSGS
jgi:hypothetical protein